MQQLNEDVDTLYDYGIKMANSYISDGHGEGNLMMKEFDKMVDNLVQHVDAIQEKSEDSMNEGLMTVELHK